MAANTVVKSQEHYRHVLTRIRDNCEGVMFWNASREFRIMLRHVDEDSYDISIVCDPSCEKDDLLTNILIMECEGFMDEEDCCYVLENYGYIGCEQSSMNKLNAVYNWCLCACAAYFVKTPQHTSCLYCTLSAEENPGENIDCPVCLRASAMSAMLRQSTCCGQYIHALCLKQWLDRNPTCPLCRRPAPCKNI